MNKDTEETPVSGSGPVLLTEAEAIGAWNFTFHEHAKPFDEYCAELRERGLIAHEPEPVDPVQHLAAQICVKLRGPEASSSMVKEVEEMIRVTVAKGASDAVD